ncbi:hypothetical protein BGZ51_008393 [Haplosporangium sp. Z 767]|nr:hypothetical protein BGZ51_008393 [Haplosporangium sp. Z 767]
MITVPSQEIAVFLGSHLHHVLRQTGNNFLSSVAANREFRAGCAIMDVLNAVESVQTSLRLLLEKNRLKGHQSQRQALEVRVVSLYLLHCLYNYLPIQQNPFLCLFVDIYNLAVRDDKLRSERFVTSLILNGKGEELAPRTPSELIALAQMVESRPVNMGLLEEYLPEVPIEEQVKVGLGWDSQQKRGDKKRVWETFTIGSRHGDENDPRPIALPVSPPSSKALNGQNGHHGAGANGVKESRQDDGAPINTAPIAVSQEQSQQQEQKEEEEDEEEELEEWEIEAERRFQDSDVDEAPSLPALKKSPVKPKATTLLVVPDPVTKKISPVLEQATAAAATTTTQPLDQDPVKRRRKTWQRK